MKLLTKNNYYNAILLIQIAFIGEYIISSYLEFTSSYISIFRYILYGLASFIIIKNLIRDNIKLDIISNLFLFWIFYLIIFAMPDIIESNNRFINFKQFISGVFLIYLYSFLIKAKFNIQFYYHFYKLSYSLSLFYLIITVLFFPFFSADIKNGGEGMTVLLYGLPILLLTFNYHSKRKQWIIISSAIVGLIVLMILARRNGVAFFGSVLFFTYLLNFFSKPKQLRRNFFLLGFVIILFLLLLVSLYTTSFSLFFERVETGFDSRESIIELFIDDFNKTPKDWIWGRGIFGEFNGGILGDEETGLRGGIENGYLYLILKGGWIYLGLFILISLKAIYLGLFKSNNILVKGLAILLIIYYIDMIGFGIPSASLKYFMIFVAISGCNSKWLREYPDLLLAKTIGLK